MSLQFELLNHGRLGNSGRHRSPTGSDCMWSPWRSAGVDRVSVVYCRAGDRGLGETRSDDADFVVVHLETTVRHHQQCLNLSQADCSHIVSGQDHISLARASSF